MLNKVYLGLGSNLGDTKENISTALRLIDIRVGKVERMSSLIVTKAEILVDQPDFINGACMVTTSLTPHQLLDQVEEIMKEMGRIREVRYGPRIIDIDILFYNDLIYHSETLTIPHLSIDKRNFVLVPLREIAGGFVHPVTGIAY